MASIGTMEQFEVRKGSSWQGYCRRFELFFEANEIVDAAKKRAIFLTLCGGNTYELLESLIAPQKVSEVAYKEIIKRLTNHFSPTPSEIAASFKFFKREQMPEEKVADYIAELRRLAKECNFPTGSLERMLRDRIVCGIHNSALQQQFLAEKTLTLEKVCDNAVAAEAALQDHKAITDAHQQSGQVKFVQQSRHPANTARAQSTRVSCEQQHHQRHQRASVYCESCGENHLRSTCKHRSSTCNFCGLIGHLQRVCRSDPANRSGKHTKSKKGNNKRHTNSVKQVSLSNEVKTDTTVVINNVPCHFEVDSGSRYTIISEPALSLIWKSPPILQPSELKLRDFQQNPIQILGRTEVDVEYNGRFIKKMALFVTTGNKTNILGLDWFGPLGISIHGVHLIQPTKFSSILEKYQHLFSAELGEFRGPPVSLKLNPTVVPIRLPPRRVPLAIRKPIEEELQKMLSQGILETVEYTEWATPIVPVIKSDGTIRICGDYKSTVNKALSPHAFPIPSATHLLSTMPRGSIFAKLDLAQAYQQLTVDDDTAMVQTIVTHKGAFKVKRLQFGISTAPGIFQNFIENLLRVIPGVIPYFDDVIIIAASDDELHEKLSQIFQRFDEAGIRLRKDKCVIGCEAVDFLGYRIDVNGLRPTEAKIEAIQNSPPPTDKTQLQAFLGLLNFYHAFIKGKATIAEPLHQLLHDNTKWSWSTAQQRSFDELKSALSTDNVLMPYDEKLPLLLVCDASPYGIGVVLSHKVSDNERPISFFSRTLTATERRYAQIDREALSIIAGIKKFHDFVYGREFTIVTDHKPLLGLFNPNKPTPHILSPRMMRWSVFLNAYHYRLIHRPGKENSNADGLSRLPNRLTQIIDEEEEVMLIESLEHPVVLAEDIAKSTKKDPVLSRILSWCMRGWPEKVEDNFRAFWIRRNEISCIKECLLWGQRMIVPSCYRLTILKALHTAHPGVVRMKSMARSYVWWPNIDNEIEKVVRSCTPCQESQPENSQASIHFWEEAKRPWSRVHIDFAGPFQSKIFFILVDSYSKWLEVQLVSSTSSACAIQSLRAIFATHGIPEVIVSDNGTAFTSAEFEKFCKGNGIHHTFVAPFHPSSNGQAERMVRSTKDYLKKEASGDIRHRLAIFLHHHHATPSTSTGKSPAELLFNRRIGTYFDRLHPDTIPVMKQKTNDTRNTRALSPKSDVWARNYTAGPRWIPATVTKTTGPVSYHVETESGNIIRRHIDQLRIRDNTSDIIDSPSNTPTTSSVITPSIIPANTPDTIEVQNQQPEQQPKLPAPPKGRKPKSTREPINPDDIRRSERVRLQSVGDVPSAGGGM